MFSKQNLRGAYNCIHIVVGISGKPPSILRIVIILISVIPFGFCNAPAELVNHIFHDLLCAFVVVYLDDIQYSVT